MPETKTFAIRGPFITLDAFLKAAGICGSGGEAKERIQAGEALVDGKVETRRGRKLRGGEKVEIGGIIVLMQAPENAGK